MKTKRKAKESFTVATLIVLNLSCFFFSYIVTATDLLSRISNVLILIVMSLIIIPLLYKLIVWISNGYGNRVLRISTFYSIFILCSAIEIYVLNIIVS